jgi:SNF2 family DNA or RNA helicase
MNIVLASLGNTIEVVADDRSLLIASKMPINWEEPEKWPSKVISSRLGKQVSYEVGMLLEMSLAAIEDGQVLIPYECFPEIVAQEFGITTAFTEPSPFLLKIDRTSDVGRPDFRYKYQFILGEGPVPLERAGFYVRRAATGKQYHLDPQMYELLAAMDEFNGLPREQKTQQAGWLNFAKVKGLSRELKAILDATLQKNEVIVPSSLGLDMYEDESGALSFVPKCPDLDDTKFRTVFVRNDAAQGLYTLDGAGQEKTRIVLTDRQLEVLRRMKRVRRVTGSVKDSVKEDPRSIFDGIIDDIDLPYGDRVTGIGEFEFTPTPSLSNRENGMGQLWGADPENEHVDKVDGESTEAIAEGEKPVKKTLLIDTHDEEVRVEYLAESEQARHASQPMPFTRPSALRPEVSLKQHQEEGVQWLQNCLRIEGRKGVLLADDMGVGKTLQILSFLAWIVESGFFPELSKPHPPYRPILIIAPLILLETATWEKEIQKFFFDQGNIFGYPLPLYGPELKGYWRKDAEGRENVVGQPILNIDRIRRNKVVLTTYETIRDYEFSFAYCPDGESLWSVVVTDEAQEYKTPNSKISHAIKTLSPPFRIACTGTPVENRLLDLWNLFDFVQPGLLGSAKAFNKQYEEVGEDERVGRLEELRQTLLYEQHHAFLLRRSKDEVLELPAKAERKVNCVMSPVEVAQHLKLAQNISDDAPQKGRLGLLHRFSRFYQHPCLVDGTGDDLSSSELKAMSSKLREVIEILKVVRAKREKAIIFARHKDVQRMLSRVLTEEFSQPVRIINGDTPRSMQKLGSQSRDKILTEFRAADGFQAIVLSPFVAGVGLTITEANHVIHYGRWWNPAVEAQATDRVYRLGQDKPVHVYLPILSDPSGQVSRSFDQLLDELMDRKKQLALGTLKKNEFLTPQSDEDELGFEVFDGLRQSAR